MSNQPTNNQYISLSTKKKTIVFRCNVVLEGRKIIEGEFYFALSNPQGDILQVSPNDENGSVVFQPVIIDGYFATLEPTELFKFYKIWPSGWENIGDTKAEITFVEADFSSSTPVFTFSYGEPEAPEPPNPDPIPDLPIT